MLTPDEQRAAAQAERIAQLEAQIAEMREALEWYANPVLPYAVTQINEPRSAVHADGGRRARAALASAPIPTEGGERDA